MDIKIQIINGQLKEDTRLRVIRRVQKLKTYYDKIFTALIILKKDNESKEKGYHADMRLMIKGNDLTGKSKADSFEKALSAVIESLRKRLRKLKTERLLMRRRLKAVF